MDTYTLPRSLTAYVTGNARLKMPSADWARIERMIATASPEANAAMARYDSHGQGFTVETVSHDLANLAANQITTIRSSRRGPIESTFTIEIGDWDVRVTVFQADKRGDLLLVLGESTRHDRDDDLPDFAVAALRSGRPVFVLGADGGFVNLTDMVRSTDFGGRI